MNQKTRALVVTGFVGLVGFLMVSCEREPNFHSASDSAGTSGSTSSGQGAYSFGGHSYDYVSSSVTWAEAKADAEARGGHLAIVNSADENNFLYGIMTEQGAGWAWLGATDEAVEGTWGWIDGTPMTQGYVNWGVSATGEPNPSNTQFTPQGEDYLAMIAGSPYNGAWNDCPFDASYPCFIEYDH